ncbi:MAG TPA: hypothetical protein VF268_09865 [Gammaproteobacteria bacterium]
MITLQQKMAEHGFESNERYDYIVRCLQSIPGPALRCLNVEGEPGRRKTAFANALANSMDAVHILYHDFTQEEPLPAPKPVNPGGEEQNGKEEPPAGLFDRIMNDACAFSEADKTILILDQLQAADFKDHIRIYRFLIEHEWHYRDTAFYANRKNLLVFLISEEPLYHSLQKHSFKVWVKAGSLRDAPFKPVDFQLGPEAEPLMAGLHELFQQLNVFPTHSEYKKILHDIGRHVHSAEDLKNSIYGWTEGIDRGLLYSDELNGLFQRIMPLIATFIGIEESLELTSADIPSVKAPT